MNSMEKVIFMNFSGMNKKSFEYQTLTSNDCIRFAQMFEIVINFKFVRLSLACLGRKTQQFHLQFEWNFVDLFNEYNIYFIKIHLV